MQSGSIETFYPIPNHLTQIYETVDVEVTELLVIVIDEALTLFTVRSSVVTAPDLIFAVQE
jgi:hypothetical protein